MFCFPPGNFLYTFMGSMVQIWVMLICKKLDFPVFAKHIWASDKEMGLGSMRNTTSDMWGVRNAVSRKFSHRLYRIPDLTFSLYILSYVRFWVHQLLPLCVSHFRLSDYHFFGLVAITSRILNNSDAFFAREPHY